MSSQNDPMDDLEALNAMLGGFPPGFDNESPDYQLAWLQHHIPELQQEIVQLEAQVNKQVAGVNQRLANSEPRAKAWADEMQRKYEASKGGGSFVKKPPPSPTATPPAKYGFGEFFGTMFQAVIGAGAVATLDAKKKMLTEMHIREQILAKRLTVPQPTQPKSTPTPLQQRAQIQAEIAGMIKEKNDAVAAMAKITNDPNILQGLARSYDDKIQKLMDKL